MLPKAVLSWFELFLADIVLVSSSSISFLPNPLVKEAVAAEAVATEAAAAIIII